MGGGDTGDWRNRVYSRHAEGQPGIASSCPAGDSNQQSGSIPEFQNSGDELDPAGNSPSDSAASRTARNHSQSDRCDERVERIGGIDSSQRGGRFSEGNTIDRSAFLVNDRQIHVIILGTLIVLFSGIAFMLALSMVAEIWQ